MSPHRSVWVAAEQPVLADVLVRVLGVRPDLEVRRADAGELPDTVPDVLVIAGPLPAGLAVADVILRLPAEGSGTATLERGGCRESVFIGGPNDILDVLDRVHPVADS